MGETIVAGQRLIQQGFQQPAIFSGTNHDSPPPTGSTRQHMFTPLTLIAKYATVSGSTGLALLLRNLPEGIFIESAHWADLI